MTRTANSSFNHNSSKNYTRSFSNKQSPAVLRTKRTQRALSNNLAWSETLNNTSSSSNYSSNGTDDIWAENSWLRKSISKKPISNKNKIGKNKRDVMDTATESHSPMTRRSLKREQKPHIKLNSSLISEATPLKRRNAKQFKKAVLNPKTSKRTQKAPKNTHTKVLKSKHVPKYDNNKKPAKKSLGKQIIKHPLVYKFLNGVNLDRWPRIGDNMCYTRKWDEEKYRAEWDWLPKSSNSNNNNTNSPMKKAAKSPKLSPAKKVQKIKYSPQKSEYSQISTRNSRSKSPNYKNNSHTNSYDYIDIPEISPLVYDNASFDQTTFTNNMEISQISPIKKNSPKMNKSSTPLRQKLASPQKSPVISAKKVVEKAKDIQVKPKSCIQINFDQIKVKIEASKALVISENCKNDKMTYKISAKSQKASKSKRRNNSKFDTTKQVECAWLDQFKDVTDIKQLPKSSYGRTIKPKVPGFQYGFDKKGKPMLTKI